ncbi:DUF485 domain-containing protein [Microterricola pindariensis]|uniref:Clumping factor B n=1 Tax=Microterricola pindariensis TaxID=478010 RepID=A0ABX5AUH5_9MICO|nr:DUF485 domain-containing protein [Microterricola pindariensis]PPL17798.1 hypothetical protein GY24_11080 [Microterricola pindariensis]
MGNDALHTAEATGTDAVDFAAIQETPRFQKLRSRHRRFVFPVLIACLAWYLAYVLLAAYAPALMATPVFGSVNVGLLLGLAQIVTTFAVTTWYVTFANRELDPIASEIRDEAEAAIAASAAAPRHAASAPTAEESL